MSPGLPAIAAAVVALAALAAVAPALAVAAAVATSALWIAADLVGRHRPLSAQRLWLGVAAWGIAAGLLAPAAIGAVLGADQVLGRLALAGAWLPRRAAFAAVLGLALLVAAARRWPEKRSDLAFLAVLGIPVTVAKLAYVHLIEMRPISDFAGMWSLASRIATTGIIAPASTYEWLFLERVVPYLLPLRLLLGPEPSSYEVPNVLVGVGCALVTYRLARRWFGRASARLAFALALVAPETWLAAEIPTHDIPGAAMVLLGLVVLDAVYDAARARSPWALAWGVAWGLLVLALDLQRSIGSLFLVSCGGMAALAAACDPQPRGVRRLARAAYVATALLLLPALTFQVGRTILQRAGLRTPGVLLAAHRQAILFASTTSWSDGKPWNIVAEAARYEHLPAAALGPERLALELALHPGARLGSYVRHSRTLFALGSQTGIYVARASIGEGGRFGVVPEGTVLLGSGVFAVFFVVAMLRGCWRIARAPLRDPTLLVPLVFLAALAGSLILLGQVQPRYLYPIWYLGAIYAGYGLVGPQVQSRSDRRSDGVGGVDAPATRASVGGVLPERQAPP